MKSGRSRNQQALVSENLRFAKRFVSATLQPVLLEQLRQLTRNFSLSLKGGDLLLLSGGWYVTHAGLIRLAKRCHCSGIQVQPVRQLSDQATCRYTFRATVYKSARCRGFVGYGDADPSNVSAWSTVPKCASRKPEPSTVPSAKPTASASARLRKSGPSPNHRNPPESRRSFRRNLQTETGTTAARRFGIAFARSFASINSIPTLVKAYATDFCGVKTLREATREQVENFVTHLADWAEKDRNALLCQLNSYPGQKEGAA